MLPYNYQNFSPGASSSTAPPDTNSNCRIISRSIIYYPRENLPYVPGFRVARRTFSSSSATNRKSGSDLSYDRFDEFRSGGGNSYDRSHGSSSYQTREVDLRESENVVKVDDGSSTITTSVSNRTSSESFVVTNTDNNSFTHNSSESLAKVVENMAKQPLISSFFNRPKKNPAPAPSSPQNEPGTKKNVKILAKIQDFQ